MMQEVARLLYNFEGSRFCYMLIAFSSQCRKITVIEKKKKTPQNINNGWMLED